MLVRMCLSFSPPHAGRTTASTATTERRDG
jgi:hypothetical protein